MKFVIQRVSRASVSVDGAVIGKINKGFLVLIGIGAEDGKKEADLLVRKMCGLRIFEDQDGKTNLALKDAFQQSHQFLSLRFMQTVKKEIAQVLLRQRIRKRRMHCMSISLQNVKSRYRLLRREALEQI